jgi:hypothetical protein
MSTQNTAPHWRATDEEINGSWRRIHEMTGWDEFDDELAEAMRVAGELGYDPMPLYVRHIVDAADWLTGHLDLTAAAQVSTDAIRRRTPSYGRRRFARRCGGRRPAARSRIILSWMS